MDCVYLRHEFLYIGFEQTRYINTQMMYACLLQLLKKCLRAYFQKCLSMHTEYGTNPNSLHNIEDVL